jgi:hypothetical protein
MPNLSAPSLKRPKPIKKGATGIRPGFAALLADVKGRVRAAQTRAMLAVNAELVGL